MRDFGREARAMRCEVMTRLGQAVLRNAIASMRLGLTYLLRTATQLARNEPH